MRADRGNGRVLLLVSNREKQERRISLKLDFAKLGLAEDANYEILGGAYERPEGIDPWPAARSLPNVEQQQLKLGKTRTSTSRISADWRILRRLPRSKPARWSRAWKATSSPFLSAPTIVG
jgi:hypothetical protein